MISLLKYLPFILFLCSIAMAFVSNSSPSKDNQSSSETDTTKWTPAKWKKLQHMTKFHEEYQRIFGEKASIHTIMKRRISHMNPPMPDSICKGEMQNTTVDANDIIIEYITDARGRKVKKLKPVLVKTEPDREYTQHIHSDDNLPNVPEDNFIQKREVNIDSYSETISSDSSSDDNTITADSDSSSSIIEDKSSIWDTDSTSIETTLHQIASGLWNAAEGYLTLASHVSKIAPYEMPQVIAQIPPPPIDVPWSKLQKKYNRKIKYILLLKVKEDPEDPRTGKRENKPLNQNLLHLILILKLNKM